MIFVSSYMKTFAGWWICTAVAYAVVNGITYMGPVHHGWLWVPDRPGLVSGVILAGFGISGLIFNNVASGKQFFNIKAATANFTFLFISSRKP